jgi:hypothetical protein
MALPPSGTLVSSSLSPIVAGVRSAQRLVCVATPFMTLDVARRLIQASDEGVADDRRFLTALVDSAVESGYLSTLALEELDLAGFELRSLLNLHAKIVLVDRRWGVLGSGNLTRAGAAGGNAELGIVLTAAQTRRTQLEHFDLWWQEAEPLDLRRARALRRREPTDAQRRRRRGQGGLFLQPPDPELGSFARGRAAAGYWLKLVYGDGMTDRDTFAGDWISDHDRTRADGSAGGRTPGYRKGDHVVIYVARGQRLACPAIVRVTQSPILDPTRVARARGEAEARQWPWVTEVEVLRRVALRRGATLEQIGVASTSIRQHDHIRLSAQQFRRAYRIIAG